jgi:predicted RNase H-like HicB family nuclease
MLGKNNILSMNQIGLKNVVWKEGKYYVAWNINTSVSSFGESKKEALESLHEALELHLEDVPLSKINKVENPDLVSMKFQYA